MAKTEEKTKKGAGAAKSGAQTPVKPAGKKTTAAKTSIAKAQPKAATKAAQPKVARKTAAPAKRVVARPVTRVARRAEPARPREAARQEQPKREKVAARALPTAPDGQAPLIAADGSSSGSIALPEAFLKGASRAATLFQAFIAERANARPATVATKNRARVAGGGKKPSAQSGTGRAPQCSTHSPAWRQGGRASEPPA